jgi:protease-4
MFKKIIAAFIGSLAAIWVSSILMSILSIIMLLMVVGASAASTQIEEDSILYIDLSGTINDRQANRSIQDLIMGDSEVAQNLDEILTAIDYAGSDAKISGIYINCGGSSLGYGSREELAAALKKFKEKSGKWIYAYADSYSQSDYYVASTATKMFLNPVGTVNIQGLSSNIPFFKNALDKLGVEMQIVKVGTFKSAVEPYILTEASEPSRMQTKVYLDAIWNNITSTISENRKVSSKSINFWADSIYSVAPAKTMVEAHAVNALKYRRDVEKMLRNLTYTEQDEALPLVSPSDYLLANSRPQRKAEQQIDSEAHIAVLYAVGDISDAGNEGIVGNTMVNQVIALADDESVTGLVLRVNSPGGSAFASEQIWEALQYFKSKKKPLYVSMGDYAASGGYYISCGADRIFADANTLTGSIGIFGMIPNIKTLLNDKVGVNFTTVQTNPNANFPAITQPMTAEQHAAMQRNVEQGYKLFTKHVSDGRNIPLERVLEIAEGRVWDGQTALKLKLVDEIGGLDAAIAAMAKKLKTSKYNYISYPKVKLSRLEQIMAQSGQFDAVLNIDGLNSEEAKQCLQMLRRVQGCTGGMQARMEDVVLK